MFDEKLLLSLAFALSICGLPAHAELITFKISTVLDSNSDITSSGNLYAIGDLFSALYTFDTDIAGAISLSDSGDITTTSADYFGSIISGQVQLGNHIFNFSPGTDDITVAMQRGPGENLDIYHLQAGLDIDGANSASVGFSAYKDIGGTVLTSVDPLTQPFPYEPFTEMHFSLKIDDDLLSVQLRDPKAWVRVPEPSSLSIMLAGAVGLFFSRKCRWKHN